ncbi:MAG: aminopeptidase P family protein, partial [Treponema sp.]|nr:aminopeptidase P family protein [Treponema sp.]
MKKFTQKELVSIYSARKEKLFDYMIQNAITAVVFEDCEERRNPAVRYFTGHPSDALFIASVSGSEDNVTKNAVLVPWDENLAK